MKGAVADLPNAGLLAVDFYDRNRVATWVRDHPGLIPWVRQRIGKVISGWQSYGAWAYPPKVLRPNTLLMTKSAFEPDGRTTLPGFRPLRE
jgi:hypothetical protein